VKRNLFGRLKDKFTVADEIRELRRQVDVLRELTIRAYEQTPARAASLLQLRRRSTWTDAYDERPLVSARIGAYHGGDLLFERALKSVQNQTYDNWEAIIVCDGPDEATMARVKALGDERIRCLQRPRNGPYPGDSMKKTWRVAGTYPFNEATSEARGQWIAPLDQDDEWTPDHLESLLASACDTRAEVTYGACRVIVSNYGETYTGGWPPAHGNFGFLAAIYHAGLIEFLYDVNAYLVDEPGDWNLARRMIEAGVRFDYVPKIVANYYVESVAPSFEWWCGKVRERGPFVPSAG
jgi:glycosyltransferase involved in cell wall biosynthesis